MSPVTTVRIHNTNTGKIIVAHVPVEGGRAVTDGDYAIPGVPGTGARILLDFQDPAGSVSGKLLPTGGREDTIVISGGRRLQVSTVDASNPVVFLLAEELGMSGAESPLEIERRTDVTDILEEVRGTVAEMLGIVASRNDALGEPRSPEGGHGRRPAGLSHDGRHGHRRGRDGPPGAPDVDADGASLVHGHGGDLHRRRGIHRGHGRPPGRRPLGERPSPETVRIGNPYGIMEATVSAGTGSGAPEILGVAVGRTARHILDGVAYVERDLFASM